MLWNFTVDAPSPYISYIGAGWGAINSSVDPNIVSYNNNTAAATNGENNYAEFFFNGTGIWVYGSERPNHGFYAVQLDSGPNVTYNGKGTTFQNLLFSQQNLPDGQHLFNATNLGNGVNGYFDIDYIVYQASLPDTSHSILLDNTDSSFEYLPSSSAWIPGNDDSDFKSTLVRTQSGNAKAQITFSGSSAIGLYGSMGPENGKYQCQVDNETATVYSANWNIAANQQLLCFASGLDSGPGIQHTLSVLNQPGDSSSWLEVDFVQLYGPSPAGITIQTTTSSPIIHQSSKKSTGPLIGGILGGLLCLGILIGVLIFMRRKRLSRPVVYNKVPPASERGLSFLEDTEGTSVSTSFPSDAFDTFGIYKTSPKKAYSHVRGTSTDSFPLDSTYIPLSHRPYPGLTHARSATSLSTNTSNNGTYLSTQPLTSPLSSDPNTIPHLGMLHDYPNIQSLHVQPRFHAPYGDPSLSIPTAPGVLSSLPRREQDAGRLIAEDMVTLPPDYNSDWDELSAAHQVRSQSGHEHDGAATTVATYRTEKRG